MTSRPPVAPPRVAVRLLEKALAHHRAGASMVGDLLEDFHAAARRDGIGSARRWFWRQALTLASSVTFFRPIQRMRGRRALRPESSSSMSGFFTFEGVAADYRYAVRALRQDPALVSFSIVIMGLGVGAITAVFSVMSPLVLKPLPFAEPERLVAISNTLEGGLSAVTSRTRNLEDFRDQSRSFKAIAAYNAFYRQNTYILTGEGEPERLVGVGVTDDFLDVLGVEPVLGRSFTPDEVTRLDTAAVILSHSTWRQRFASRPDIVGDMLTINGAPSEVIGVLPERFDFASIFAPGTRVDLLVPFPLNERTDRWGNTIAMFGRLTEGVTLDEASAEIAVILERLRESQPERWGLNARLDPLRAVIAGDHPVALMLLFAASGAVLLIVCVNLSSLLLSKGLRRRREMFLRTALGAGRSRLLRQLLLESLILSFGGAVLGVILARALVAGVAGSAAVDLPMLGQVEVDASAWIFSAAAALLAGLAVGLLPALQASGLGSAQALRASGRSATAGRGSRWLRESLVVAEVAVACALLVVGALLLQSFFRVLAVDTGFRTDELTAWTVDTDRTFESPAESVAHFSAVADAVAAVPGVDAVGLTDAIPLGINRQWSFTVEGLSFEQGETAGIYPHIVDRNYLRTMGIPLREGRHFDLGDGAESEAVAIINQSAADLLFPGESALGHRLHIGDFIRIVGVAADVRHLAVEKSSGLQLYLLLDQVPDYSSLDLVVRSELPPSAIQDGVAAAIASVDPSMPTREMRSLRGAVDHSISPRRFTMSLLGGFAGVALLLAALGIYGVLSYTVAERSKEITIRLALGERVERVRLRVVGRTLALAGVGAALGLVLSQASARLIASMLYGVDTSHAGTLVTVPLVLLVVAAAAG
ncbi:MAG: ADOP family duplicated permease, partial [Acidobacteriota bacterium]